MRIRKRWITLIVVIVLAIATQWWETSTVESLKETTPEQKRIPDSYMTNAVITRMSELGEPKSRLQTPLLEHFPNKQGSELETPFIEFFRAQGNPWEINANHGKVNESGTKVILTGNVVVNREASPVNRPSRLETEKLIVFPDTEKAESDVAVKIVGENYTTTGVGLKADLKTGKAQLLSRVRGLYVPAKN